MSIHTRRGDGGLTSLADGTRVSKASARVEAYGAVDELNSLIGLARCAASVERIDAVLDFAQQRLFNCSSRLATPPAAISEKTPRIEPSDVDFLESVIDRFTEESGPLTGFVLEAGCESAARLHVARAACRRAERRLVALAESESVEAEVLAFVNRLSDALFAAARLANHVAGVTDEPWDPAAEPPAFAPQ